jgi:UDP-N-acetylmuramate dehydrogenase
MALVVTRESRCGGKWRGRSMQASPIVFSTTAIKGNMTQTGLIDELRAISRLRVKLSEPLARYTSMKIGGCADIFLEVDSLSALCGLLPLLHRYGMAIFLLGNGSNVLVSDSGVRGAVIHLAGDFKQVRWQEEGERVWAQVGAAHAVAHLVREAARRGYAGLEFAEGIPGTIGGALIMNAGAYGSEIEKVVEEVTGVTRDGNPLHFTRKQMTFSYRDSHLPAGTIVTQLRLRLHRGESATVSSKVRDLVAKRKASQPSGHPNSGSMFRNPRGDYAGRLIEAAGLKGMRIGQAQISERHGNFIVNLGGAAAEDVRQLMELARAQVQGKFGIALEPEVRMVGEWPALGLEAKQ